MCQIFNFNFKYMRQEPSIQLGPLISDFDELAAHVGDQVSFVAETDTQRHIGTLARPNLTDGTPNPDVLSVMADPIGVDIVRGTNILARRRICLVLAAAQIE